MNVKIKKKIIKCNAMYYNFNLKTQTKSRYNKNKIRRYL